MKRLRDSEKIYSLLGTKMAYISVKKTIGISRFSLLSPYDITCM